MDPIPVLPIQRANTTDEEGDAAVLGTARLALWVGLTYFLASAGATPVYFLVWHDRNFPRSWLLILYPIMLLVRAAGGAAMFWASLTLSNRRTLTNLKVLTMGALAVLASYGFVALTLIISSMMQRRSLTVGLLNPLTNNLLRELLASLPAVAVLLLARAAPVRNLCDAAAGSTWEG